MGLQHIVRFLHYILFFEDVDVIIMDDVHSCEDYIMSNWTIQIDGQGTTFIEIAELLKTIY